MLIILDRQHRGRARKPNDSGAVNGTLIEADLVEHYIAVAQDELHKLGHATVCLTLGEYWERQDQAVNLAKGAGGKALYLACHVNAGGGKYALVEHDQRSKLGKAFAVLLARTFAGKLTETSGGKTVGLASDQRGFTCISGIYAGPAQMTGVIVEPGFIDSSAHASLWSTEGLSRIGKAIAVACDTWSHS